MSSVSSVFVTPIARAFSDNNILIMASASTFEAGFAPSVEAPKVDFAAAASADGLKL